LLGSVFVFHEGGVSFGDDANELQNHAMQVLEQRYPAYRKIISEHVSLDPARKLRENIDEARLSVDGQARLVLMESRARFNKLSTELKINAEAQEKTEHLLNHELQIARDFGKDQSLQLRALEKEMGSLETYAENRAAEATEYAGRIRQLEATATQLGENLRSMSERIGQYDLRVEQYDALLEEARGAYRESEAARRDLISINSALTQEKAALQQDNDELRSFLTVRIQIKLLQLMGKR
jgi:prefoldin subunit 5